MFITLLQVDFNHCEVYIFIIQCIILEFMCHIFGYEATDFDFWCDVSSVRRTEM